MRRRRGRVIRLHRMRTVRRGRGPVWLGGGAVKGWVWMGVWRTISLFRTNRQLMWNISHNDRGKEKNRRNLQFLRFFNYLFLTFCIVITPPALPWNHERPHTNSGWFLKVSDSARTFFRIWIKSPFRLQTKEHRKREVKMVWNKICKYAFFEARERDDRKNGTLDYVHPKK